jgi:nucleotide-binding universal stress UspA family protein
MYQHILAAIDKGTASDRVLQEAVCLAKDQHAALRFVYVVDEVNLYSDVQFVDRSEIEKKWIETGRKILGEAQSFARSTGVNAEIKILATENIGDYVANAIKKEAKDWPADIVVAGTSGRGGLMQLIKSSVAADILRICPVPILLVRG